MKKIYYPSPLKSGLDKNIDYGDPFIYRFNGEYYLFTTGANPIRTQGHVYKSLDLVNYEYLGHFTSDPLAVGAFAPEIIYWNSYFYLATSPLGKGHYIFKSKNIEGPYERITDNIGLLIDGSFTIDKNNKLHFLYASRQGIMMCEMDENGNTKNHHQVTSSLEGWTEGASIVQRNGKYYLFYCGNHFQATGYRIQCAVSEDITGPYIDISNNPLLIDTDDKYTRLGHSSETISLDLNSRLMMYHSKTRFNGPREIFLSRIRFSNDNVALNHSSLYRSEFNLPTYENRNVIFNDDLCLSNLKMNKLVNIECLINNGIIFLFSYVNENNYSYLSLIDNKVLLIKRRNNKDKIIHSFEVGFNFIFPHTFRLLKEDNNINLYIDDVYISHINDSLFNRGYVGYKKINENAEYGYFSFFNINMKEEKEITLPGMILSNEIKAINDFEYEIKIKNNKDNFYHLSASLIFDEDIILNINNQEFSLKKNQHLFKDDNLYIGKIFLKKKDVIKIKTNKKIEINYLNLLVDRTFDIYNNFSKKGNYLISNDKIDNYFLFPDLASYPTLSLDFKILNNRRYHGFGFLFNVTNFSKEDFQCREHYNGLLLEYDGHLLNLIEVNYKRNTLGDFRLNIEENIIHNLKIEYYQKELFVYLDNNLIKKFFINSKRNIGRYGFYMASGTEVEFISFKKEEPLL